MGIKTGLKLSFGRVKDDIANLKDWSSNWFSFLDDGHQRLTERVEKLERKIEELESTKVEIIKY